MECESECFNSIEKYFEANVWKIMSDYEKLCYLNRKKNYEFFIKMGKIVFIRSNDICLSLCNYY